MQTDPLDADHEVLLYLMLAVDAGTGQTGELCGPDVRGERLAAYYQPCIRLVRADYCGGHGTTRDGMLIDI